MRNFIARAAERGVRCIYMDNEKVFVFEGVRYKWTGSSWYDATDNMKPPLGVIARLNALIAGDLKAEDEKITDPDELVERAKQAQAGVQMQRALELSQRALKLRPTHFGTAAVVCSILRKRNRPDEALLIADRFRDSEYPPLLTSRAAALCDLERWDEALKQIRQVLAISNGASEALAVYSRIKAGAPSLFTA